MCLIAHRIKGISDTTENNAQRMLYTQLFWNLKLDVQILLLKNKNKNIWDHTIKYVCDRPSQVGLWEGTAC